MEEDKKLLQEETVDADKEQAQDAEIVETQQEKKGLVGAIKKFFKYLETHEDLRQLVFFMMFSLVCWVSEMVSYYAIDAICKATDYTEPFKWFVFDYTATNSGGQGGFLAFLISTIIAQILTFVLNRKKTFKATNNVVWSACMYAVMVVAIVIANAALCGIIKSAIMDAMLLADIDAGLSDTVAGFVSKMVGGALAWVINFVMSKFVIMRSPKKKVAPAEGIVEETADSNENVEEK